MPLYTNRRRIPLSIAVWLADELYNKDPTYISGSQLSRSNRQIVLSFRATKIQDLSTLVASRLGTAVHEALDAAWQRPDLESRMRAAGYESFLGYEVNPVLPTPGKHAIYIRQRFNEELAGKMISGAPDLILMRRLFDYKSTSVFVYQKKEEKDYLWQLTVYRWLARDLIDDDVATIQFILKDWSEARANKDPEYPQTPCPTMLVRVGTAEECRQRIVDRVEELKALMSLDQSQLPLCSDEELWLDPPKYAYYKDPFADGKGRATRVFESYAEASAFMGTKNGVGKIITRKGEPKACDYCEAASICEQRASWNT
jgi:hypothetical protein